MRVDTATLYVRYQRDNGEAGVRDAVRVAWWMLQYTLGVIDMQRVAEQALRSFKGKREQSISDACEQWFLDYVVPHVADAGRHAVARHLKDGDVVAIATGATPYAAGPLARALGIEHVLSTHLEVEDGRFTGRVREPMGYGPGKVLLAERLAQEQGFSLEDSTFYSDSITDLPLFERVRTPIAVNPDRSLEKDRAEKKLADRSLVAKRTGHRRARFRLPHKRPTAQYCQRLADSSRLRRFVSWRVSVHAHRGLPRQGLKS